MFLAMEGALETSDLWWLYDEYRIMPRGDAWLLAMLWEHRLTDKEADRLMNARWGWFEAIADI